MKKIYYLLIMFILLVGCNNTSSSNVEESIEFVTIEKPIQVPPSSCPLKSYYSPFFNFKDIYGVQTIFEDIEYLPGTTISECYYYFPNVKYSYYHWTEYSNSLFFSLTHHFEEKECSIFIDFVATKTDISNDLHKATFTEPIFKGSYSKSSNETKVRAHFNLVLNDLTIYEFIISHTTENTLTTAMVEDTISYIEESLKHIVVVKGVKE